MNAFFFSETVNKCYFSSFAYLHWPGFVQGGEHSFGAKALAQYAIRYRDDCWEELEGARNHPQAPGTVAIKPHYFAELDVVRGTLNPSDNLHQETIGLLANYFVAGS
jgi:hypothetical protein